MIKFSANTKKQLLDLFKSKNIGLEGNILKLVDTEDDSEFTQYVKTCIDGDKESRKKRLDITKQIQKKNNELETLNTENNRILEELQLTLDSVETSKKQIECQNNELLSWKEENERIQQELQDEMKRSVMAREEAEHAKANALSDLDLLQKKTQTELMGNIVKVALGVIAFVAVVTTGMYVFSILMNKEVNTIGPAWSNMFGILLTNAFSIVGTIMGVKYATKDNPKDC
jgi:chromosome segregation ATPase